MQLNAVENLCVYMARENLGGEDLGKIYFMTLIRDVLCQAYLDHGAFCAHQRSQP